jgi:Lipase (class 3)
MISQRMPRITLGANLSFDQFGQALAFTYLSQYSGSALEPRVFNAYTYAFGATDIVSLAPGTDNNPGVTLALFRSQQGLQHCLVAIHGATDFPSFWSMFAGIGYQTVTGCTGSVFNAFASRAATMWTRLFANADFAAMVASNRTVFTFTGHSLGAAMAEILAYRFKAANPWRDVRCIKFASPRVGTSRWKDNRNPNVKFASIYVDRDPIHHFPVIPSTLTAITDPTNGLLLRNFARDDAPWRLTPRHFAWVNHYTDDGLLAELHYAGQAVQSITTANPWFDHLPGAYRNMFMNYCAIRPDALKYRFNYLENPDENQWQVLFTPGMREYAAMNVLDVVQPDPVQPISGDVGLIANAPEQVQQVAPMGDTSSGASGGGDDWGGPRAATISVLPARRVRPR